VKFTWKLSCIKLKLVPPGYPRFHFVLGLSSSLWCQHPSKTGKIFQNILVSCFDLVRRSEKENISELQNVFGLSQKSLTILVGIAWEVENLG